jgi:hypothetical protein
MMDDDECVAVGGIECYFVCHKSHNLARAAAVESQWLTL